MGEGWRVSVMGWGWRVSVMGGGWGSGRGRRGRIRWASGRREGSGWGGGGVWAGWVGVRRV